MTDNKPAADVTKDWQATQGQKSAATRLRLFAAISWIIAIGTEVAGVVRAVKVSGGDVVQDGDVLVEIVPS